MSTKGRIERIEEIETTLITPELNKQNTAASVNLALAGLQEDSLNFKDDNITANHPDKSLEYTEEPENLNPLGILYKKYLEDNYLNSINNIIVYNQLAFINEDIGASSGLINRDDRKFATVSQLFANENYTDDVIAIVDKATINASNNLLNRSFYLKGREVNSVLNINGSSGQVIGFTNNTGVRSQILIFDKINLSGAFLYVNGLPSNEDSYLRIKTKELTGATTIIIYPNFISFDIELGKVECNVFSFLAIDMLSAFKKRTFKNTDLTISTANNFQIGLSPATEIDGLIFENISFKFNTTGSFNNGVIAIHQSYTEDVEQEKHVTLKNCKFEYTGELEDIILFDFENEDGQTKVKIEGVVTINNCLIATNLSDFVYTGSGTLYHNGVIVYDGGRIGSVPLDLETQNVIQTVSLVPNVTINDIIAGQELQGETVNDILQKLLIQYLQPVLSGLSVSGHSNTVEVGTTFSGTRNFTWNISNVINLKENSISIQDVSDNSNLATGLNTSPANGVTLVTRKLTGTGQTQQWRLRAENTRDQELLSNIVTATSRFRRYWQSVASIPANSAEVRALNNAFQTSNVNSFILPTGVVNNTFVIFLEPGVVLNTVIDQTALNADITSQYIHSPFTVEDVSGDTHTYNRYVMTIPVAYSSNHNHFVTTKAE